MIRNQYSLFAGFLLFIAPSIIVAQGSKEIINISNTLPFSNPASVGMKADINVLGQHKQKTIAYGENPFNGKILLEGRIPIFQNVNQLNLSGGLGYEIDKGGARTNHNITFLLANRFILKNQSKLSFGISYRKFEESLDKSKFIAPDGLADDVFIRNPIEGLVINRSYDNYIIGGQYESTDKKFIAGIGGGYVNSVFGEEFWFNSTLGKTFTLGRNFNLSVNSFISTDFSALQAEIPLKFHYKEILFVGNSFIPGDSFTPIVGGRIKNDVIGFVEIGAGYSMGYSGSSSYNSGAFQVYLNYYFTNPNKKEAFSYF